MATPHASISLLLNGEDPFIMVEDLLNYLNNDFLKPKSMQMNVLGSGEFDKFPASLDGAAIWPRHQLPDVLPGEKPAPGTQFTLLENPDDWLRIPRDTPHILERLRVHSAKAGELWVTKQRLDDDTSFDFWGLTKIFYAFEGSTPKAGYFLRERLLRGGGLEPLLRVTGHVTQKPRPYVYMRFLIRGYAWSCYTHVFDEARNEFVPKTDLRLAKENARFFAETLAGFLRRFPNAEVEWESDQEHSPNLLGFIPAQLQARFGPPETPRLGKDISIIL